MKFLIPSIFVAWTLALCICSANSLQVDIYYIIIWIYIVSVAFCGYISDATKIQEGRIDILKGFRTSFIFGVILFIPFILLISFI